MHPTFRSPELQGRFSRDGFVIIDLLEPDEVAHFRSEIERVYVGERADTAHTTIESSDLVYRRKVHEFMVGALAPHVERLFVDHEPFNSAAFIKWKGPNSLTQLHQDWTAVDEARFRSCNMWIPLVDTSAANGAMRILPGSQRKLTRMRTSPRKPDWFDDPVHRIDADSLPLHPMRAGSCMVIDNGVLHASPPNLTDEPRFAVIHGLAPRSAQLLHHTCHEDDRVETFEIVERSYFLGFQPGMIPSGPKVRSLGTVPFETDAPDVVEWLASRVTERVPALAPEAAEEPPAPAEASGAAAPVHEAPANDAPADEAPIANDVPPSVTPADAGLTGPPGRRRRRLSTRVAALVRR